MSKETDWTELLGNLSRLHYPDFLGELAGSPQRLVETIHQKSEELSAELQRDCEEQEAEQRAREAESHQALAQAIVRRLLDAGVVVPFDPGVRTEVIPGFFDLLNDIRRSRNTSVENFVRELSTSKTRYYASRNGPVSPSLQQSAARVAGISVAQFRAACRQRALASGGN